MIPSRPDPLSETSWRSRRWLILILTLMAWILATTAIQRPSYWIDEKISMDIAAADSLTGVIQNVAKGERRPPAYHLGLWAITSLSGSDERIGRLYSAMWAVLFVPAVFQLARHFGRMRAGVIAAILAACSSLLMSYGQIIRYYTMVAALSTLSFATFLTLTRASCRRTPPVYLYGRFLFVTALLIASDFPAYGVLAAQNVLIGLMLARKSTRTSTLHLLLRGWVITQTVLVAIILSWMPIALQQGARDLGAADLANSFPGAILRVTYPFYAWLIGENVFPWSPIAIIAMGASIAALLLGLIAMARQRDGAFVTWVIAFLAPFTLSQYLLSTVANDSPFVNAAARTMSVFGLLLTLVACGINSIRRTDLSVGLAGVLVAGNVFGLANYYNARDTINPIYSTPAREAAQWLYANYRAGDIVIAESDTMVQHYLPREIAGETLSPDQSDAVRERMRANPLSHVWLVTLGRDRTRNATSETLAAAIESRLPNRKRIGFAEQDALYRLLKTRLLGREAYQNRLVIDRFSP